LPGDMRKEGLCIISKIGIYHHCFVHKNLKEVTK
jgi:hypothetical protein